MNKIGIDNTDFFEVDRFTILKSKFPPVSRDSAGSQNAKNAILPREGVVTGSLPRLSHEILREKVFNDDRWCKAELFPIATPSIYPVKNERGLLSENLLENTPYKKFNSFRLKEHSSCVISETGDQFYRIFTYNHKTIKAYVDFRMEKKQKKQVLDLCMEKPLFKKRFLENKKLVDEKSSKRDAFLGLSFRGWSEEDKCEKAIEMSSNVRNLYQKRAEQVAREQLEIKHLKMKEKYSGQEIFYLPDENRNEDGTVNCFYVSYFEVSKDSISPYKLIGNTDSEFLQLYGNVINSDKKNQGDCRMGFSLNSKEIFIDSIVFEDISTYYPTFLKTYKYSDKLAKEKLLQTHAKLPEECILPFTEYSGEQLQRLKNARVAVIERKEINYRSQDSLYPGKNALSDAGFLARDETLADVIEAEQKSLTARGRTYQELTKPILFLLKMLEKGIEIDDKKVQLQSGLIQMFNDRLFVMKRDFRGSQESPFGWLAPSIINELTGVHCYTSCDYIVKNLSNNEEIFISPLAVQLAIAYQFPESSKSPYYLNSEKIERVFSGFFNIKVGY